jgi:AcrR family transcriptional regulator
MPRPARFSDTQILDATATLVAGGGPGAATIGAIGAVLDAPSGSIYHRFPSRDVLLGRLWLSKAAFFQGRFVAALRDPDPWNAGREAALSLPRSVRADFAGARIMLLHRRDDFLSAGWPADLSDEAVRLRQQVDEAINDITRRLFGRVAPKTLRLTTFAILDVPFAAVHRHVANGTTPPGYGDGLIDQAYSTLVRRRTPRAPGRRSMAQ